MTNPSLIMLRKNPTMSLFEPENSKLVSLTVLPEPEPCEYIKSAPPIEKATMRNNCWDNEIALFCYNCSAENVFTPNNVTLVTYFR